MTTRASLFAALLFASSLAHAQTPDTLEAGKRFSAGVALYNEADYRAALVEFKRAYEIAPSAVVLYNIGQTQYQLQDYAAAYVTLSRFLAESDKKADHRAEVEQTIALLQARIGKIALTTDEPGAEVFVDDDLVGKTPLAQPVLVSVGKRKVEVRQAGKQPWERTIEVAAGDVVRQDVTMQSLTLSSAPAEDKPFPYATAGWITTGVLAAGAITFGVLAYTGQNTLDDKRNQFGITRAELTDQADKVSLYSGLADGLGLAALAVGGATLIYVLTRDDSSGPEKTQVGIGPGGIIVGGTF